MKINDDLFNLDLVACKAYVHTRQAVLLQFQNVKYFFYTLLSGTPHTTALKGQGAKTLGVFTTRIGLRYMYYELSCAWIGQTFMETESPSGDILITLMLQFNLLNYLHDMVKQSLQLYLHSCTCN